MTQLIKKETVGLMLQIKNEVINVIKENVKDKPIKDMNLAIFNCVTGKKLVIKDVYIDQLEEKLTIRTLENERIVIENPLEQPSEDMDSIILTTSELTRIVSYIENQRNEKIRAINTIAEIAKENNLIVDIKEIKE